MLCRRIFSLICLFLSNTVIIYRSNEDATITKPVMMPTGPQVPDVTVDKVLEPGEYNIIVYDITIILVC